MNPGFLRDHLRHKAKPAATEGTYGHTEIDWDTVEDRLVYGRVEGLTGRELEAAQQVWAEAKYKVTLHYINGKNVNREDRLYWGTRVLDIGDVRDPYGNQTTLFLLCRELVR